jgi:hypothetical protein
VIPLDSAVRRDLFRYDASSPLRFAVIEQEPRGEAMLARVRYDNGVGGLVSALAVRPARASKMRRAAGVLLAHGGFIRLTRLAGSRTWSHECECVDPFERLNRAGSLPPSTRACRPAATSAQPLRELDGAPLGGIERGLLLSSKEADQGLAGASRQFDAR